MITVSEALQLVLRELPRLGAEQVALTCANGRVLARPVEASRDVPPFRNAAMDGYAVRAECLAGASAEQPIRLRVLETIGAGAVPGRRVERGTATRIMTGAAMPEGADTVVRVEDTSEAGEWVEVLKAEPLGAAVRHPGEDIRAGEQVLEPGRLLRAADIGVLASLGVSMVSVVRRPKVAILATGDELVDVGEPLGPGQIVNSNVYTLAAAVEETGGEPLHLGIVRDTPERIRAAFADAFTADVVLSTGGVSAGMFDYVREILRDLGCEERFWKVAQKPGKPLTFGLRQGTPVFGLPGNPVSALVCFYIYVLPALRAMLGVRELYLPTVTATMAERVRKAEGLTEFLRCTLHESSQGYSVRSTGTQSSAVLRSLSLGDGLIIAPADSTVLEEGSRVRVLLLPGHPGASACPF